LAWHYLDLADYLLIAEAGDTANRSMLAIIEPSIASELNRIRARPIRYYVVLPLLRVADMWLRPRTEILPPDVRWWEFNDDTKQSVLAVGFGVLNLAYLTTALVGLVRRPSGVRWAGLLVGFLLLRSAFLGTLENPEPRYTLEYYPAIIVLASSLLAGRYRQDNKAS